MFRNLFLPLSFFACLFFTGCTKDDANDPRALDASGFPVLITNTISGITQTSATSGGNITYDGGLDILSRGICWSTLQNPTFSDSHTSDGTGTGSFTSIMNGLTQGTTYYVRAYATNKNGTAYGDQKSFTTDSVLNLSVGDTYAGGIIFYLDTSGLHGLVCAPSDQSDSADWGCTATAITGADGTAIGTGWQNTLDILSGCASATAAQICDTLSMGGFNDWYLPSKEELRLIYTNLHSNGQGNFTGTSYWSSSEMTASFAWQVIFSNGITQGTSKSNFISVRAIRSF